MTHSFYMTANYDKGHFTEDKRVMFRNFANQYALIWFPHFGKNLLSQKRSRVRQYTIHAPASQMGVLQDTVECVCYKSKASTVKTSSYQILS